MDFEFVCIHPPAIVIYATYFLLAYPFLLWVFSAAGREPMSVSVVPAALTPLFLGSAMASVGMANLLGVRSIGITRLTASINVRDAMVSIAIGAFFAALVSGFLWLRAHQDRLEANTSETARNLCAILVIAFGATIVANVLLARAIVEEEARFSPTIPLVVAIVAALGALVSFGWLIASRRIASLQLPRPRRIIAAVCTGASCALVLLAWGIVSGLR